MNLICSPVVLEALGSEYDEYTYLSAQGTRGGILLTWRSRAVTITDASFSANAITTKVSTGTGNTWGMTVVYGPQTNADKIEFLQELRDIRTACTGPWMVCGDFNLILRDEDKNTGSVNRRMMGRFRRLLNHLLLKEVYLAERRYIWTNNQSPPTLVHLDRVFCISDWEDIYPNCHLRCLASVVSDHSPLMLDCSAQQPMGRRFHFKEFWLRMDGYHGTVTMAWTSITDDDPFCRLMKRMQATARGLTSLSLHNVGSIKGKMEIARELISRFDKAQEDRLLTPHEAGFHKQLKLTYLGLASLRHTMARQCA